MSKLKIYYYILLFLYWCLGGMRWFSGFVYWLNGQITFYYDDFDMQFNKYISNVEDKLYE